ncbi:hypothetical protein N7474_005718 [Penicillium riverlandense]|uniref:uncharacterized protein n=1 Tax=Penicillium riverlandense TaxID=1903569 RepID=UPI002548E85B|nr:uncharacterized protein N7474_005718 [Penicillium riverlandense]KAJ5820127.1 hypothetical protein N7474_005718 [Penicillium riverlandense]
MSSPTTTSPDAIFSDESSFYGDVDEQARLEELVATYDPEPYWSDIHPYQLSTRQYEQYAAKNPSTTKPEPLTSTKPSEYLPPNRRGENESIPHFLSRLPPSTTQVSETGPWIWAYGHPPAGKTEDGDTSELVRRGTELLRAFEDESASLRAAHDASGAKTTAPLTRKLNVLRRGLEADIASVARETRVLCGKWMLFPTVDRVDSVWGTVAQALEDGRLGDIAKVAPDDGSGDGGQARLICVYTANYEDKEDVKRVLNGLVDVGLVNADQRPIYYKCDAYTMLDIKSKNDFGLKASLFSSRDVLSGKV